MKVERFIREYANYQKKSINSNDLMKRDIKESALNRIDNVLKAKERGLITVNETMQIITNSLQVIK